MSVPPPVKQEAPGDKELVPSFLNLTLNVTARSHEERVSKAAIAHHEKRLMPGRRERRNGGSGVAEMDPQDKAPFCNQSLESLRTVVSFLTLSEQVILILACKKLAYAMGTHSWAKLPASVQLQRLPLPT